jgi:protein-tyrosine kinase
MLDPKDATGPFAPMSYHTARLSDIARSNTLLRRSGFIEQLLGARTHSRRREEPPGEDSDAPGSARLVPGEQLIIAHDPNHPRSEQLRSLRAKLLMKTAARRAGVFFALLSPCPREGRSQLAAELAVSFAQLGGRTLLVDADFRRPSQHEIFGASNELGLVQALTHGRPALLQPVRGLPKMAVLTSGGQPANPVELLHGLRFRRLAAEWRRDFEYVVFDTPPVAEFADGLAVATAAGNVLVLSRAKATTFHALREMRRHLEPVQARVVGAIINDF